MLPDLSSKIRKIPKKIVLPKEGRKHDRDFGGGVMLAWLLHALERSRGEPSGAGQWICALERSAN